MSGRGVRWAMACVLFAGTTGSAAAPSGGAGIDDARNFDWETKSPADFLDVLRAQAKLPEYVGTFAAVETSHRGWVKEADLPGLVALVDSKERCAHIATPLAQSLPDTRSFVAQEALVMIQAFREGAYPPPGLTTSKGFYARKAEILAWWKARP
jgi:hypothetical protein